MNSTVFCKKNAVVLIILAILVLIPTVLAVLAGKNMPQTVITETTKQIVVRSPDGTEMTMENKEDLDFYSDLIAGARPASADYLTDDTQTPFVVTIGDSDGAAQMYSFYPSGEKGDCLFVNANGEYFMIDKTSAAPLFLRSEFAYANVSGVIPEAVITIFDKTYVLKPSEGEWVYYSAGGEELHRAVSGAAENEKVRFASEVGTLSFGDMAPDSCNAVLTLDGTENYSGLYENIVSADMLQNQKDTTYDLTVTATWEAKDAMAPHGTVTYRTKLLYDVPADYEIIYDGVMSVGDFAVVKMHNFNDGETLSASCEGYPVPETLHVYQNPTDEDSKIAFIPAVLDKVGSYELTLTTEDGASKTLPLTVRNGRAPRVASQNLLVTDAALQQCYSKETVAAFNDTVKSLTAASVDTRLWNDRFVYPNGSENDNASTGLAKFGTTRSVKSVYSTTESNFADEVQMAAGSDVAAANDGVVVFADTLEYTGNTVIIDHGCSLLTVYGHLDTIAVSVGSQVTKGESVGSCGATGFAVKEDEEGAAPYVLFAVSIDGGFMNPANIISGVKFG